jgi:ATP-dependent Clp protease ATP-binding subunit ClpA
MREVIVFHPLAPESFGEIARPELDRLSERRIERGSIVAFERSAAGDR